MLISGKRLIQCGPKVFYVSYSKMVLEENYDVIRCKYSENVCPLKVGLRRTDFFRACGGVHQACDLLPTLFNLYTDNLAKLLKLSSPRTWCWRKGGEVTFFMQMTYYHKLNKACKPSEHPPWVLWVIKVNLCKLTIFQNKLLLIWRTQIRSY